MSDDETASGRVGQVVDDRYQLTELMASGAMGEVYKAERVPVGKLVAVKFLHASFVSDSEFQTRFDRETRVMSKLAHPNCVSVVDFGVWKDTPYLVMDYVAGITLRKRLDDQGALPAAQALAIARQITAGLAHAHEEGIIHRDVKPANIMITDEIGHGERVRILDFGLARLRGNVGRDATQSNMVVGTPNYMAPEQTVPAGTIDARTDLYAVGIVLFEMVVGERPFAAEDTMALLGMHRAAPIPRLSDRVPMGTVLPEGLQALVDKAMAKSPDDRFQSAIEFADAIDEVLQGIVIEPQKKLESVRVKRAQRPSASAPLATATSSGLGAASTQLQLDATKPDPIRASSREPKQPPKGRTMVIGAIVFGGAIAMGAYFVHRLGADVIVPIKTYDAAVIAAKPIAPVAVDATVIAPDAVVVETGSGSNNGIDDAEIEMDPAKAEDLDPAKGSAQSAQEEAADAPKTNAEAEAHEPVPTSSSPQHAPTLHDAVTLIKDGKREEALASLQILKKQAPKSAYIPFLMGNLHFDKTWWAVAMDNYAEAIHKNTAYRSNAVINRNLIKMLSSSKTRSRAQSFLKGMGHPAVVYIKYAAAHDSNPLVKKFAAALAKQIR